MRAALSISIQGKTVLDVGCGSADTFALPEYCGAALYGVDVDSHAIADAKAAFPGATFRVASAEKLPFSDASFDSVISRVALPYTDIPIALREIHRVLKPHGELWATLHSWKMQWVWFGDAVRRRAWIRVADHGYMLVASIFHVIGWRLPARPWNGTRESFQTEGAIRRDLSAIGFEDIEFRRDGLNFMLTARKLD